MSYNRGFKRFVKAVIGAGLSVAMVLGMSPLNAFADTLGSGVEDKSLGMKNGKIVVVLDPGHDDTHLGARNDAAGLYEEDLNLKIATYAYEKLSAYDGFEVYMTRYTEDCPYANSASSVECNRSRVKTAASQGCDLYVAIHLNASTSKTASGAEIYYQNRSYRPDLSDTSKIIADTILENLEKVGVENRGPKMRNSSSGGTYDDGSIADYYSICYNSKINGFPGFIIEHCFMDNPVDYERFLTTEEGLKALGEADADAIASHLQTLRDAATNSYSAIFDPYFYRTTYPDVAEQFAVTDEAGMLEHFLSVGIAEQRQGCSTFDVIAYYAANPDLREKYGEDYTKYYYHYMSTGQYEDRVAYGSHEMVGFTTELDGVDYSDVYDYNVYTIKNPDVAKAFPNDDKLTLMHFVNNGMKEGRTSGKAFDVRSYRNAYPDLRAAFKKDWKKYFDHYRSTGKNEGRVAVGVSNMMGYPTSLDGVDYSAVYDYNFYTRKYPDIIKALGDDENVILLHFVKFGMKEKRQAKSNFNVSDYMENYEDLRTVFGDDILKYYTHYMQAGIIEGRTGVGPIPVNLPDTNDSLLEEGELNPNAILDESLLHPIMGATNTTVEQMMAYYLDKTDYPLFYLYSDAPTLRDFCQMYLEECQMEGVRTEVAFVQAMLETNFLRYTGDVQIEQYNFAGIGATGGGEPGYSFEDVRTGIRAQIQHLKAYASDQPLVNPVVDPRFEYVTRETAKFVEYLGINENPWRKGWATGLNYGFNILKWIDNLWKY